MSAAKITIAYYHSVVCPRCQLSRLALRKALKRHPDVEVTNVEFLSNMNRAKKAGVRSIPALVAEGRSLTGIILTSAKIE